MVKRIATYASILLLAAFALAGLARAMDVQPLRITLVPSKGQTSGTLSVNNTRAVPLTFEVLVERRIIAEDGNQTFEPAEDDFIVFPPQGSVVPGRSQAIRFQYVGTTELTQTQGYVIRVKEVPIMQEGFSGVQFAYAFGVAVYIQPAQVRNDVRIDSAERSAGGLRLRVSNSGNDYALLTDKKLRIEVGGKQLSYERQDVGKLIGLPLIAPASTRFVDVAIADLPPGDLTTVAFDELR